MLWNRPEPVPTTDAEEEAFEQQHHIAVRTDGGRSLAAWGMGLALLVAAIAFSTLLLSYFYLRHREPAVAARRRRRTRPDRLAPSPAGADRRRRRGDRAGATRHRASGRPSRLRIGLVVGGVLIAAGGVVQVVDLAGLDFSAQDHAYGSIVLPLSAGMVALALVGLVIVGVVLAAALRDEFTSRRHAAVINVHRYAVVLASLWVIGAATLYLTPRLT